MEKLLQWHVPRGLSELQEIVQFCNNLYSINSLLSDSILAGQCHMHLIEGKAHVLYENVPGIGDRGTYRSFRSSVRHNIARRAADFH